MQRTITNTNHILHRCWFIRSHASLSLSMTKNHKTNHHDVGHKSYHKGSSASARTHTNISCPQQLRSTVAATSTTTTATHRPSLQDTTHPLRTFSSSDRTEVIFQKLIQLDIADVRLVTEFIAQRLGATITERDRMGRGKSTFHPHTGNSTSLDQNQNGNESKPVEEVKTIFDVKMISFEDKSKIKVIKEIRTITGLGLKEAKDLVEGVPKIVKKGLKKEEAEELKNKLQASGATIELI